MEHKQEQDRIAKANSKARDALSAAKDLGDGLATGDYAAIVFFTAGDVDIAELGRLLDARYPRAKVIGCTTAGVIGDPGYANEGVCAFGLPASHFHVEGAKIPHVSTMDISEWTVRTKALVHRFREPLGPQGLEQSFGLVLIDGLSMAEETVLSALYPELGDMPLFGGSAGDDLKFNETLIFFDGVAHKDSAVLILIHTDCPFKVFRTEHFVETQRKMVITEADPASRIVREINASPAAEEYARLIGVQTSRLNASLFAANPVMVRVAGSYYVRSIQRPDGEDGLRFFCAIDEGLVLTLAKGQDIVTNLEETFRRVEEDIGEPELIIGCDCIFRKLELEQDPDKFFQVSRLLNDHNVYGFNTYGEQFAGMHVNQTFTGVAIGRSDKDV